MLYILYKSWAYSEIDVQDSSNQFTESHVPHHIIYIYVLLYIRFYFDALLVH